MVETLERSVAVVLNDHGGVAGTTFLFRSEEGGCYWFTCHHVIAELSSLRLGINFNGEQAGNVIAAEYVADASAPDKDIAVLKTPPDAALEQFLPLPMGDARIGYNESEKATGIGFTPGNIKSFQNGRDFAGTLRRGQEPQMVVHQDDVSEKIAKLGNPWNKPNPYAKSRVFVLRGADVPLDGGFSGSPVCITTKHNSLLCIGMLSQSSTRVQGLGFAIQYQELFSAARTLIPFYPYADCVILVIAAKLDEITPHVSDTHVLEKSSLCKIYSESDRDGWKCMEDKDIKELVLGQQKADRTWQLATIYLDDLRELETFIKETAGPLFYILDSCSLTLPELEEIVKVADSQHYRAAYLFPRYEARFTYTELEKLRAEMKALMPNISNVRWVKPRVRECTVCDEFEDKFWDLLEKAVQVSAALVNPGEMERLLAEARITRGAVGRMPIPSVRRPR